MKIRHSIKSKIFAIGLVGILGFTLYLAVNIYSNQRNRVLLTSLSSQEFVVLAELSGLESNVQRYRTLLADAVDFDDISNLQASNKVAAEIQGSYEFIKNTIPQLQSESAQLIALYRQYHQDASEFVTLSLQAPEDDVANLRALKNMSASSRLFDDSYEALKEVVYQSFQHKVTELNQQNDQVQRLGYGLGGVIFCLVTFLSLVISRSVSNSLQLAVDMSARIAGGDLRELGHISANDETGELLSSLDTMRGNIFEAQRGFVLTAAFTDATEGDSSKQALIKATGSIRELFNFPCCALFVATDNNTLSCVNIATLDSNNLNVDMLQKFDIAENCFKLKRKTSFEFSLQDEKLNFNFGLGKAELFSLQSHPLFYNNQCIAVLVTCHISLPKSNDMQLLEQCNERLALKVHAYLAELERENLLVDLEQRANELEELNDKNVQLNAAKSEFLACMSHEIRTPMNGIMGMLGLLMRANLPQDQYHYADVANDCAKSLLLIINDILDFTKIESGKLELEEIEFDLRTELGSFAESMANRAQDKGLELVLDMVHVDVTKVVGDPGRLRQILVNLVGNAIKFTEQGDIVIRGEIIHASASQLQFNCSVIDTGIGIGQHQTDKLFKPFTQADASTTRQFGGTGLGLSIAKQLCELMGGSIGVNSEQGRGSRFDFNITLQSCKVSADILQGMDATPLNILVVDDNRKNLQVLCEQFKHWGARVNEAANVGQALQCLDQEYLAKSSCFDLVLIDMDMPHQEGAELAKKMQQDSRFESSKRVLMTSMAQEINSTYLDELSLSGFFRKPATTANLVEVLALLSEANSSQGELIPDHGPQQAQNLTFSSMVRILLVEDNAINQMVAINMLEDLSLSADVAGNGVEAVAALNAAPRTAPYQVILMDCQMPEMDGYEATRQIRLGAGGGINQDIPIIAMTANAMKGDKEKCLAAGMNDYLAKPIDVKLLASTLGQWLTQG